jgi:hypothetical protein
LFLEVVFGCVREVAGLEAFGYLDNCVKSARPFIAARSSQFVKARYEVI